MRIGTLMQGTHLKYREWAIGLYLYAANIKGVSSMGCGAAQICNGNSGFGCQVLRDVL